MKGYKEQPDESLRTTLDRRFDEIFLQKTNYETLNQTLKRIHANKTELLRVLDRPEIPLHTNGSKTDIRDYVKNEKSAAVLAATKGDNVATPLPA